MTMGGAGKTWGLKIQIADAMLLKSLPGLLIYLGEQREFHVPMPMTPSPLLVRFSLTPAGALLLFDLDFVPDKAFLGVLANFFYRRIKATYEKFPTKDKRANGLVVTFQLIDPSLNVCYSIK